MAGVLHCFALHTMTQQGGSIGSWPRKRPGPARALGTASAPPQATFQIRPTQADPLRIRPSDPPRWVSLQRGRPVFHVATFAAITIPFRCRRLPDQSQMPTLRRSHLVSVHLAPVSPYAVPDAHVAYECAEQCGYEVTVGPTSAGELFARWRYHQNRILAVGRPVRPTRRPGIGGW